MGEQPEHLARVHPALLSPVVGHLFAVVAEEVAEVFPDLVVRNEDGSAETVLYDQLPSLLLNELQKQQRTIAAQAETIADLAARLAQLEALFAGTAGRQRQP